MEQRHRLWPVAILPIVILALIGLGWFTVLRQRQTITDAAISAYQQTQLEIVRALARSVESYVFFQAEVLGRRDRTAIEQEVLQRFIAPVRLLENGDAWIYAPDHVVFDLSSDFPKEYRGKSMAEIFAIQHSAGATNYEAMRDAVMEAREGVGWYIWLPEKGREIAAWTPVRVSGYTWSIGLSTPLPEILASTGAEEQIGRSYAIMSLTSLVALGLLASWLSSTRLRVRAERALQSQQERYTADLRNQVEERTADLQRANAALRGEIVERTRTEQALQRSNGRLELMYELGRLITAQLELDALLSDLASSTAALLHAEASAILLLDKPLGTLTIRGAYGLSSRVVEQTVDRVGQSIAGRVVASGQPLVVNHMPSSPMFDNPVAADEGLIACASVPLLVGQNVIGTLDVHRKTANRPFGDEEVQLLRLVAGQAVIAIENARLYAAAQQEIAERVRAEQDLIIARDAAEVASKAKSAFLSMMSHELRTPLTGIIGYTDLALLEAQTIEAPHLLSDLEAIKVSGHHLLTLINSVLELAKIEAGKVSLSLDRYPLGELITNLATTIRPLIEQNRNRLVVDCYPPQGEIYTDITKVRQILLNLLSNAAKFTTDGLITLTVTRECAASGHGDELVCTVSDTGIGIDQSQIAHIFDAFTQIKSPRMHGREGTGLGLTISYNFAQLMGGTLSVESVVDHGSCFTFRVPLVEPPEEEAPLVDATTIALAGTQL